MLAFDGRNKDRSSRHAVYIYLRKDYQIAMPAESGET